MPQAHVDADTPSRVLLRLGEGDLQRREVVGVDEIQAWPADDVFETEVEDGADGGAHVPERPVGVVDHDDVERAIDEGPVVRLSGRERFRRREDHRTL